MKPQTTSSRQHFSPERKTRAISSRRSPFHLGTHQWMAMVLVLSSFTARAKTFTVNTRFDQNDNPSGAEVSLREALRDAAISPGEDTILFYAVSQSSFELTLNTPLVISDPDLVTVDGWLPHATISVKASTLSRLFEVAPGTTFILNRIKLSNGYGRNIENGYGGAVLVRGQFTAFHCSFENNYADASGGAIYQASGICLIENCTFSGNTTGLLNGINGTGGAIASMGGDLTLRNSTFTINSTANGNSGASSAAVLAAGTSFTMQHCTVAGNHTGGLAEKSTVRISTAASIANCIIATNSGGSEVLVDNGALGSGSLSLDGGNIIPSITGGTPINSGVLLTSAPLLAPLADNGGQTKTMALLPGSPALDGGAVLANLATRDQRGFLRNRDGDATAGALPDIGAFEAQAMPYSIGFNFAGGINGSNTTVAGTLAAAERAGVPFYAQSNWNNLLKKSDGTLHDGTYGSNGPVNINSATGTSISPKPKLWWMAPNTWHVANPVPSSADGRLMNGYLDSDSSGSASSATNLYNSSAVQPFFAVAGLPEILTLGGYRVVVYVDGSSNNGQYSQYWLTTNFRQDPSNTSLESRMSRTIYIYDLANFAGTYYRSTNFSGFGASSGSNYLVFDSCIENGFILRAEELYFRAPVNAVQIVRNDAVVVTTVADENDPPGVEGTGISLREAIRDAPDGGGILFDPSLSGQTIIVSSSLAWSKNLTLDASNLHRGIALSSGGSKDFDVLSMDLWTTSNSMRGLHFKGIGTAASSASKAIVADGFLALSKCTFSDSFGELIQTQREAIMTNCTFHGNNWQTGNGMIIPLTSISLYHCTIAGNLGTHGMAIPDLVGLATTVTNSIISNNSPGNLPSSAIAVKSLLSGDSKLSPFGYYAGSVPTLPPAIGSLAIDGGLDLPGIAQDQRGFKRSADGDFNNTSLPDIGAVEIRQLLVNTTVDTLDTPSGTSLSLREAVRDQADYVRFAPALSGQTISLASEIALSGGVSIDATDLPGGLTFDDGQAEAYRLFSVAAGEEAALRGVRLAGGGGALFAEAGGAVANYGVLRVNECTFIGNSAATGGAIASDGELQLGQSTFVGNIAHMDAGGAVAVVGRAAINHCTFVANAAAGVGGAVANFDQAVITHCTLTDNQAAEGGAASNQGSSLTLRYSIAVDNVPDNIFGDYVDTSNFLAGDPLLAPLAEFGGLTSTRALRFGSPAKNAALGSPATFDQRGVATVEGIPDLGAYEAGGPAPYEAWIYESFPPETPVELTYFNFDYDGDGKTNEEEFAFRSNPASAVSLPGCSIRVTSSSSVVIEFQSAYRMRYVLQQSSSLAEGPWSDIAGATVLGDGTLKGFPLPTGNARPARLFFRVVATALP